MSRVRCGPVPIHAPTPCRVANFKARSTAAIKKVMVVYPGLSGAVESIPGGLRLKHCQPPIAEQKSKLLGDR